MNNISTVIFDLGRVLVDIVTTGKKFGRLMEHIGIPPEEAFEKFWYSQEVRQFMTGDLTAEEFFALACARFELAMDYDEFAEAWSDIFQPVPAMRDMFLTVAERYRIGLLSDTDPLHWARLRTVLPWLARVEKPTLSYEVGYLKPHPNMFAAAAANCGSAIENCLFIDDLLANVDGARYCGMPALVFSSHDKLKKDLTGLGIL